MYKFLLRLMPLVNDRIDKYISHKKEEGIKIKKNQFITEAILDKLKKVKF